jgi:hypothetical protein
VQFLFGLVCGVHSSVSARLLNVTEHSALGRMLYTILEESFGSSANIRFLKSELETFRATFKQEMENG